MLLWYCHKSEQFVDLVDDSSRENLLQNPHLLRCFLQNAGTQKLKFPRVDQREGFRNFDPPVAETLGGVCRVLCKIRGGTVVGWDAIFTSDYFQQKMSNKKSGPRLPHEHLNGCEHSDIACLVL